MGTTTYAQAKAKFTAAVKAFKYWKLFGYDPSNANNFTQIAQAYETTAQADGDAASQASAGFRGQRKALESVLVGSDQTLAPLLQDVTQSPEVAASGKLAIQAQIDQLVRYMVANSERVTSRLFTRGAFAPGSPYQGNPTWLRVTTDENGLPLEASYPEALAFLCDQDQTGGTSGGGVSFKGRERWRVTGAPFKGLVERGVAGRGSGLAATVNNVNGDDSKIQNSSFAQTPTGGDATPSTLPSWTTTPAPLGDGTDFQIDRTNFFQESANENGSPAALKLLKTFTISQKLRGSGSASVSLTTRAPWHDSVMLHPGLFNAVGIALLTLGSKSVSLVVNGGKLTSADSGGAGNPNGTYQYVVTFVVSGVESMYGVASTPLAVTNHQINLTTIPVGPAGTTARNVYRTVAGGSTFLLLTTIGGNAATTFTDNVADGSLGAAVTTANGNQWLMLSLDSSGANNLWLKNWDLTDAAWSFAWTRTAGSLNVDRGMLLPYVALGAGSNASTNVQNPSSFLLPVSGATPTMLNDQGSITDTANESAWIQFWIDCTWDRSLPSCPPALTGTCTVALSATAGAVTTGTHVVAVTALDANGNESGPSAISATVTGDGAHNVDVSTIPVFAGSGIVKRKLYMSKAGTTTPLYYAGITLPNNVATTATGANGIAVADGALTQVAPAGVTWSEPS